MTQWQAGIHSGSQHQSPLLLVAARRRTRGQAALHGCRDVQVSVHRLLHHLCVVCLRPRWVSQSDSLCRPSLSTFFFYSICSYCWNGGVTGGFLLWGEVGIEHGEYRIKGWVVERKGRCSVTPQILIAGQGPFIPTLSISVWSPGGMPIDVCTGCWIPMLPWSYILSWRLFFVCLTVVISIVCNVLLLLFYTILCMYLRSITSATGLYWPNRFHSYCQTLGQQKLSICLHFAASFQHKLLGDVLNSEYENRSGHRHGNETLFLSNNAVYSALNYFNEHPPLKKPTYHHASNDILFIIME